MGAWASRHLFDLVGGRLSLEFVNTTSGMRGERPEERITEYADLTWWAEQVGLVDRRRMQELLAEAEAHPRRAEQAREEAVAAREALHDVILAALLRIEPPAAQLEVVNRWVAAAMQRRRLRPAKAGGFEAAFDDDGDLLAFLRPVAADAANLLERELPLGLVRRCDESEQGRCGWLFVDETRNHSRRFCSMKDCGNRAKQRRYWKRQREA
jgi:predicted RNA-binding Zn ribbon-like protein